MDNKQVTLTLRVGGYARLELDIFKALANEFDEAIDKNIEGTFAEEYVERMVKYALTVSGQVRLVEEPLSFAPLFDYDWSAHPGKVVVGIDVDFIGDIQLETDRETAGRFLVESAGQADNIEVVGDMSLAAEKLLMQSEEVKEIEIFEIG
ncbi:hypothetical protein ACLGL1_07815 [Peptococcus simiae]|uniref:hypothetical protein n=1 Tax=Peptococcus simiae TaxID=1643805 RepID=UPI00397EEE5C